MGNYWLKSTAGTDFCAINNLDHVYPGLSDFTYCAWIKTNNQGGYNYNNVLVMCLLGEVYDVLWGINYLGILGFGIVGPGRDMYIAASIAINDNKRHLVTITCGRSETDGLKLYIDGVEVATPIDPTELVSDDITKGNTAGGSYVNRNDGVESSESYLDQIRFYKTVLTPEQIAAIYKTGIGVKVDESEFAAVCGANAGWYSEFDDGTGATFSGRYWNGSTWSDSDGTLEGNITYELGGVPWDCKVYRGQDGDIDYENPVAVMGSNDSQVSIPNQALPPNTIWHYIRRQAAPCGLESPDSPACIVRINSAGEMLPETPNQPLLVTAIRLAGGKFLIRWRYTPIEQEIVPTEFRVYADSGSGFNFTMPDGTVNYKFGGTGEFKWESAAYTHGQRVKFCVRAYALGETQNTDYVAAVADALGPDAITDVFATVEQLP